jgi:hypothetical protein
VFLAAKVSTLRYDYSMELKRLMVSSGEYKGRYIGQNIGGLRTNPELLKTPEVPIPGTGYSMYAQEGAAFRFNEANAINVQVELKKRRIDTALTE